MGGWVCPKMDGMNRQKDGIAFDSFDYLSALAMEIAFEEMIVLLPSLESCTFGSQANTKQD